MDLHTRRRIAAMSPWGILLVAGLASCSQVLGLEDWKDPPDASVPTGAGGSATTATTSSTASSGGSGGGGGATTTSASTTASVSSGPTSSSAGVGGQAGDISCADGVKNGMESDLDCGGDACSPCGLDQECGNDGDCGSGICAMGRCVPPMPKGCVPPGMDAICNDCVVNGLETDVDCGGDSCLPCGFAQKCLFGFDCTSGKCTGGVCAAGGHGTPCRASADCMSAQCQLGACWTGSCCQ